MLESTKSDKGRGSCAPTRGSQEGMSGRERGRSPAHLHVLTRCLFSGCEADRAGADGMVGPTTV